MTIISLASTELLVGVVEIVQNTKDSETLIEPEASKQVNKHTMGYICVLLCVMEVVPFRGGQKWEVVSAVVDRGADNHQGEPEQAH